MLIFSHFSQRVQGTEVYLIIYNFDSIIAFLVQTPIDQQIAFRFLLIQQLNFINLQLLQQVVKGFFILCTFLRTNQWVNNVPPITVVKSISCIGQHESIDIEKRRPRHSSRSSILHFKES